MPNGPGPAPVPQPPAAAMVPSADATQNFSMDNMVSIDEVFLP